MMQYVILAFEDGEPACPEPTCTHESPRETFMRRFANYRELRKQIGSSIAAAVTLSPEEERVLLSGPARGDKE